MDVINHLRRGLAPIASSTWQVIDGEARNRLTPLLTARQVVDFVGPGGWEQDNVTNGDLTEVSSLPAMGALTTAVTPAVSSRDVQKLVQVRTPFTLTLDAIERIERGKTDTDFTSLDIATRQAAQIENAAIFNSWPGADIPKGIAAGGAAPSKFTFLADVTGYPAVIASVTTTLRTNGIAGPYTLAISTLGYNRIMQATENGGFPLSDHLLRLLGGKIVWVPGLSDAEAIVLSERGGDFVLTVGQDFSVGYTPSTGENVNLYLEESFTFRVARLGAAMSIAVEPDKKPGQKRPRASKSRSA